MDETFWKHVDQIIAQQQQYILSNEERQKIQEEEQKAYEANLQSIQEISEEFASCLSARGFTTKVQITQQGFLFTYAKSGYYGPTGFKSNFHIDGPLVLALLPPGNKFEEFITDNDVDKNFELGSGYTPEKYKAFLQQHLLSFLNPNYLVTTEERRELLRTLQTH